jgi:hypothetical protein
MPYLELSTTHTEQNWPDATTVGQANNPALTVTRGRTDGTGGTFPVRNAIQCGNIVSRGSDNLIYLASAEAGSGQRRPIGVAYSDAGQGEAVDVRTPPATWFPVVPFASAPAGTQVYLSASAPGELTTTAPSGAGVLVLALGEIYYTTGGRQAVRLKGF